MLVSYEWLNRYIDINISPEELSARLTMMGLEATFKSDDQPDDSGGWVLEVDITPNRADCLSIRGIAREIFAMTGSPVRSQEFFLREADELASDYVSIIVEEPDRCPHYSARLIRDVTIAPSPKWLSDVLRSAGLRSVNNIVDITNFILLDEGQPLHAFDYSKIAGNIIGVRTAKHGEVFETLDGKAYTLMQDDLLITDREKGIALAGIMGGINSEVSDSTKDILLESAYFEYSGIRRSSRRLGIHTESSHRFGRGVDPDGVVRALDRAAAMMAEIAGGRICRGIVEHNRNDIAPNIIRLRVKRLRKILGIEPSGSEIHSILVRLGFSVIKNGDEFSVTVPSYRTDIEREVDLIEEVARIHGYSNINSQIPHSPMRRPKIPGRILFERELRSLLRGKGLQEAINYSFIGEKFPCCSDKNVKIRNPINQEMSLMRQSLIPSIVKNALVNINRGNTGIGLFEIGHVYINADHGILEKTMLSACLTISNDKSLWRKNKKDFYDMKGIAQAILSLAGIDTAVFVSVGDTGFFHPDRSAAIKAGKTIIGRLGELSPILTKHFDLIDPMLLLEFDIEFLYSKRMEDSSYAPISRYPAAARDLALIIDETIEAQNIKEVIKEAGGSFLKEVIFFDYYKGKQIPADKKSLACTLVFESSERTLTEDEVNRAYQGILDRIEKKLGGALRS